MNCYFISFPLKINALPRQNNVPNIFALSLFLEKEKPNVFHVDDPRIKQNCNWNSCSRKLQMQRKKGTIRETMKMKIHYNKHLLDSGMYFCIFHTYAYSSCCKIPIRTSPFVTEWTGFVFLHGTFGVAYKIFLSPFLIW